MKKETLIKLMLSDKNFLKETYPSAVVKQCSVRVNDTSSFSFQKETATEFLMWLHRGQVESTQ